MNDLPLHPAIVHLPLALAMLVPLAALFVVWRAWRARGAPPSRAMLAGLVVAQALLVAGGLVARAAGEHDEELVEAVVPELALEAHESASGGFVVAGAIVLVVLVAAWVVVRRGALARALVSLATLGSVAVAALGLSVGHSGGALVYQHGAARAHGASVVMPSPAPGELERGDQD